MNNRDLLFGRYLPTGSWVHRIPVGLKYLLLLGLTVPALIIRTWWLSAIVLAFSVLILLGTKISIRLTLFPGRVFLIMLVIVASYQVWARNWQLSFVLPANILSALYLSRMLTITTPGPVLIDALIDFTRPLDRFGFRSERFGLAVAIMVRSVPFLLGSFSDIRDAARARGRGRNLFAQITPVVVSAVAYARRTGEALQARGIGDE